MPVTEIRPPSDFEMSATRTWASREAPDFPAERILARQGLRRNRPLTAREIRFPKTCKTERAAQIELGKLLAMAQSRRQPDSDVIVAQLLDQYVSTAGWDLSTLQSNLGYIRRTVKPALGSTRVRKVRGPDLRPDPAGPLRRVLVSTLSYSRRAVSRRRAERRRVR